MGRSCLANYWSGSSISIPTHLTTCIVSRSSILGSHSIAKLVFFFTFYFKRWNKSRHIAAFGWGLETQSEGHTICLASLTIQSALWFTTLWITSQDTRLIALAKPSTLDDITSILQIKFVSFRWFIIISTSDSTTIFCHILSINNLSSSRMVFDFNSSHDPHVMESCRHPQILPKWSRAIMLIPPCRVDEHHEASQLIFITPFSGLHHFGTSWGMFGGLVCPLLAQGWTELISIFALLISMIMTVAFGVLFSNTSLHLTFQMAQHVVMQTSHLLSLVVGVSKKD